ncbi:MAG TPA: methyltransferase domain-containing protein [Tepidisphaeraceae bacterium]|nr:methyltransferase domain-containing protein [Tepidisphaeraceae bacterium]
MTKTPTCWCGNASFARFNDEYWRCAQCETLVTAREAAQPDPMIKDDDADFYGRNYWFKHQEQDLGFANIETRARTDLPERCQHWLRTLLRYKLPPARTLELGCAHGGFVAMLRTAGFDSSGLELSPAIVDFARRTFDVPMLEGPIERQDIPAATLDVIAMMDVMEHLPDPVGTLSCCAKLLKPDGILLAQTPRYPEGKSYEEMLAENDPFLEQLKPQEHLYLFSERSARELFGRIGLDHFATEPAMFGGYDMYLFVSPAPLKGKTDGEVEQALLASARGRMTLCWLDMEHDRRKLRDALGDIEADRAKRLDDIKTLTAQLEDSWARVAEIDADRARRLERMQLLAAQVDEIEADRAMRLERIESLTAQVNEIEADRGKRLETIVTLTAQLGEAEADRENHLGQIETLTAQVGDLHRAVAEIEADRAERLAQIESLTAEVIRLRASIVEIEADRAKRLDVIMELDAQVKRMTPAGARRNGEGSK